MAELSRLEVEADARKAQFDRSLDLLRLKFSARGLAEEALRQVDAVKPGMAEALVRSAREEPVRTLSFATIAGLLMREALRPPKPRKRSKSLTSRQHRPQRRLTNG